MDKTKALLMGTQNHEKEMMVFDWKLTAKLLSIM